MKNKKIIVFILTLFLFTGVSYALLSDTITVSGTATTTGTFDINITDAVVDSQVGSTNSTINISNDKKSVSVDVPKLEYPGSYTKFSITIKNEGNINAKLVDILENSMGDSNVLVSYTGINKNSILIPNQTLTFTVKVEWKGESTEASTTGASIDIDFVYEQSV